MIVGYYLSLVNKKKKKKNENNGSNNIKLLFG